jgi:hypothetical protein
MPDASNFKALKKEALGLLETLATTYKTKLCHKREAHRLNYYSCEDLKYN